MVRPDPRTSHHRLLVLPDRLLGGWRRQRGHRTAHDRTVPW